MLACCPHWGFFLPSPAYYYRHYAPNKSQCIRAWGRAQIHPICRRQQAKGAVSTQQTITKLIFYTVQYKYFGLLEMPPSSHWFCYYPWSVHITTTLDCTTVQSSSSLNPGAQFFFFKLSICISPIGWIQVKGPIALTSVIMKCFERLVKGHITSTLPDTLHTLQFSYRPNRSTDDAITITLPYPI